MKLIIVLTIVTAALASALVSGTLRNASSSKNEPTLTAPTEAAIFAGGCFWGLQAAFDELPGVVSSRVGYIGGSTVDPNYSKVVVGSTGHAEAVEVTFDSEKISFAELVQFHLEHVRPSSREADANYAKKHYRQSIFVRGDAQRVAAKSALAEFNRSVTDGKTKNVLIEDATVFWEAEAEHQNYLAKCAY